MASKPQQLEGLLAQLSVLFADKDEISSTHIAEVAGDPHETVMGLLRSLHSKDKIVMVLQDQVRWYPTDEGSEIIKAGSPEKRLFELVKEADSIPIADLKRDHPILADVGLKNALKNRWLVMNKATKSVVCATASVADLCQEQLSVIASLVDEARIMEALPSAAELQNMRKRKLVDSKLQKVAVVRRGEHFSTTIESFATELTRDMILTGAWRDMKFKPYNWNSAGQTVSRGSVHPLMRVMAKFKAVLMNMHFEEMPTNQWVESSFWNFDALFQPQQHPARDAQDTFFLKTPDCCRRELLPSDYFETVRRTHEVGGFGSIGYRSPWSEEETCKNILRTHTTAVSARMLFEIGQEYQRTGVFRPRRLFSIDRVFRNETLDATHLAEFHQVEGLCADRGLSLTDLMSVFSTFYEKIGITDLKFKPAFNPYTEPSMEIFGYHPLLKKWIEVGNSGIFRPEMLLPMGLPEDVNVIAWGLSLERPTMIRYGIRNIRELFGHKAVLGCN
ncbi:MAG: uncharacterized protein KVP18_001179 [Porospora cf. gigantea A]|uniref:uncharacterized protein n=1 Tax=Porospora cf. gigantea A TaxID=2853593 RepID=UPI00355981CD|nr:MAG: hypothetical protein KVP18_001179 [Porospora cf. gigantea A]